MSKVDELPRVEVTSRAQWGAWLAAHHAQRTGIWLVVYKKHCGDRHVAWPDVVREALCWGWIDCRTRRLDEDRTSLLITPRRAGSIWSATNKRLVAELDEAGLLRPPGRALIEAARADGSWTFLDDIDALIEPDDLVAALDAEPAARATWNATSPSVRKQALYWIKTAKRAPTRSDRIAKIAARTGGGEPPV
jgi:uncharacterized protein YdeI (YjbR/CyaY-like superfamily)